MVSLKDIAKECGVSTATVSKALNGQHDIGEETKARVRETAERMGYFPNAAARALKTNRSYNVGVLFQEEAGSGLTHEYFSGVLNGIKVQVEKMGYDVTFINNSYGVKKTSFFEHCRYRNFEGIVIVCADFASQGVLELMNSAFPVVTIDYTHYNCTAVCSNNVKGMEELLKYIYKDGETSNAAVAYCGCPWFTYWSLKDTWKGNTILVNAPEQFYWGGTGLAATVNCADKEMAGTIIKAFTCDTDFMVSINAKNSDFVNNKEAVKKISEAGATCDYLYEAAGQDIMAFYLPMADSISAKNATAEDQNINSAWSTQVKEYAAGNKDKDTAIADFKSAVHDSYSYLKAE